MHPDVAIRSPLRFKLQFVLAFQSRLGPGNAAIVALDIHQYNVRPNVPDAVPGNHIVLPGTQKSHMSGIARNQNGADIPLRNFDLYIPDESQPSAVPDADHFLALQIGEFY